MCDFCEDCISCRYGNGSVNGRNIDFEEEINN